MCWMLILISRHYLCVYMVQTSHITQFTVQFTSSPLTKERPPHPPIYISLILQYNLVNYKIKSVECPCQRRCASGPLPREPADNPPRELSAAASANRQSRHRGQRRCWQRVLLYICLRMKCMYVYACMYVYIYTYMYTYIYVYIYTCIQTYTHV